MNWRSGSYSMSRSDLNRKQVLPRAEAVGNSSTRGHDGDPGWEQPGAPPAVSASAATAEGSNCSLMHRCKNLSKRQGPSLIHQWPTNSPEYWPAGKRVSIRDKTGWSSSMARKGNGCCSPPTHRISPPCQSFPLRALRNEYHLLFAYLWS